ncbi:MAG: GspH/FimT family pseudopilin [Lysobacter sp.]|nr:GspH/FimT family pseudopilin [Lysobacter sp.]
MTLLVLGIVIGFSIPMFTGVTNGSRLTANANELVAAVQSARSEAIRRNLRASLCESDDGATCSGTSPWNGWIVFADANGNGNADVGEIIRVGTIDAPMRVTPSPSIALANNRITFRADGLAYDNAGALLQANIRVCMVTVNPQQNVRDVNLAVGGRVGVRPPINGAGACPAPGDI